MRRSANRPGLLVSVRNAAEALAALRGGADVIDVKEPSRGPLGAADSSTIEAVVRAVDGQAPVTAAMGELTDYPRGEALAEPRVPRGVALFKLGLAGCRTDRHWPALWRAAIERLSHPDRAGHATAVAVVYADWRAAAAPDPNAVMEVAVELGCPALLVDTWDKSSGSLFEHGAEHELRAFLREVRSHGIAVALAGSLTIDTIAKAVGFEPDLVAVRTAACEGGRQGSVAAHRVSVLQQAIGAATALGRKLVARNG